MTAAAVVDVDRRPLELAVGDIAELRKGQALRRRNRAGHLTINIAGSMATFGQQMQALSAQLNASGVSIASSYRTFADQMAMLSKAQGTSPADIRKLERQVLRMARRERGRRELASLETALIEFGDAVLRQLRVDVVTLRRWSARLSRAALEGFAAGAGYRGGA